LETFCLSALFISTIFVVLLILWPVIARPWHTQWGATEEEVAATLPGDELVPTPKQKATRAVTIDAPPEEVWPWIVQMGYKRAGWYTYDWFYKLTKSGDFVDGRSSNRIVPELQDVKTGDVIMINSQVGYTIMDLKKPEYLVELARVDFATGETFELDETPEKYMNGSWVYVLKPVDGNKTRLITRSYGDWQGGIGTVSNAGPLEFGAFVMFRKMMLGVKKRSENNP
jgi:hypothetical protein